MLSESDLQVSEVYADEDLRVLDVGGALGLRSATELRRVLIKALTHGVPVVVDVSRLVVAWSPGVHVFAAALQGCGGWPEARLALAGPSPALAAVLRSNAPTVHIAPDVAAARRAVGARPARVTRSRMLSADTSSPGRARRFVRETLRSWDLAEQPVAELVASELVTNCVVHTESGCTLTLTLDDRGVTLSVHDPVPHPEDVVWVPGGGLRLVAGLARSWGITPHAEGGKAVWATLPSSSSPVTRQT